MTRPTKIVGSRAKYFHSRGAAQYIVAAAVLCPATGIAYIGASHHDARLLAPKGVNPVDWEHGFLFNTGRFFPKDQALAMALKARQVAQEEMERRARHYRVTDLLSEMLLPSTI